MRRFSALLMLAAAVSSARAATVTAPREVPRIIVPGAGFAPSAAPGLILPFAPEISIGAAPSLILPESKVILAPAPAIITAARALTEEEAASAKLPSQADLMRLADSLAPSRGGEGEAPQGADRARLLDAAFDGELAPEASAWSDVSERFASGPRAPGLPVVETAARSLIARLLPAFYRRVPTLSAYDRSERPMTGHTWTPEKGHLIELAPSSPDSRGKVPSAFGVPGSFHVQQKIEHLMGYAHEYFHVLFDSAVNRRENHPAHSAYSAMTEGFAVAGEQLLIDRMIDMAPALSLGPGDTLDLSAVSRGRREWMDVSDNHYSEGIISWRKAYMEGGTNGVLSFLAALSARRMIAVPRSDPAYQLVLGDPKLVSAYLGRDPASPERAGAEAFAKAARGETLTEDETRDAAAVVERAGPDGWRRLFDRTLLSDKRIEDPGAAVESKNWWEKAEKAAMSVVPAFALARLSPSTGAALSRYLADAISAPGGAMRLFERNGPNPKLNAIIAGAESLPWDEAGRKTWNDGLTRWFLGSY